MLPLLAALAAAQDLPLPTPEPRAATGDWVRTYDAGMNTARAGAIVGGAGVVAGTMGVVLIVTGAVREDYGSIVLGGVALVGGSAAIGVGPPIMAGGSLRAARGLEDGGYAVSRTPGYLAWGLWGGSMLLSSSGLVMTSTDPVGGTALSTLSALAFLGSYAAGGAQMAVNGAAFRRGMPMVYVGPVPMEGGAGATVAFRF